VVSSLAYPNLLGTKRLGCCWLVSNCHCLDVPLFEKIQDYKEEGFEQQQVETGKCP
jgi:hypothetical protein